ncbi:MAG TPA: serine/threonine-protein kinase [Polyangiaceae bacterium]|nr:serine/threonine-protein kinase [Polyangiaceae bacterium]
MVKQAHSEELEGLSSIPQVGEVIAGKYRIDSELGSGGMGVVLCATHLDLGQRVAIKVLTVSDEDERRDEARSRFLREGRATAALVSDHVVRVYDVGTLESGAPFMVMELLRGYDLARILLQQGPLSIERACDCVRQAADAIACAHAQNIVHRDLKPSNLFLTQRSDGTPLVKVLDFGISKTTGSEPERITSNLTADRSVLGTPFYMSPEQVRDAKAVDQRTDIWSLGLILHELLSGSPAFEGTTLPGVCAAIAADPPAALRLKRPEVPPEVEAIVLRCLEKDPAKRFQTARELVVALTPWAGRTESSTLNDATVRSSSGHGFEELRAGDTITLTPPSDTGTLASAVFTRSGPRLKGFGAISHSKSDATLAEPPLAPHSTPRVTERGFRQRGKVALTVGGVLLLALAGWVARGTQPRELQPTPSAAAHPPPPAPLPPPAAPPAPAAVATSASFSLQIDSTPAGAEVYEADHLLGTTPLQLSVDSGQTPRTFALRKSGYLPYTIVQGASAKDAHVLADLAKAPTGAAPRPTVKKPVISKEPSKDPKPGSDIFMQR